MKIKFINVFLIIFLNNKFMFRKECFIVIKNVCNFEWKKWWCYLELISIIDFKKVFKVILS